MKITAFNPAILTRQYDDVIKLFEELGFSKRHRNDVTNAQIESNIRMKDENGFYIDINNADFVPQDATLIRMNVDNFDEGFKILTEHGFTNALGEGNFIETPFLKGAHMTSKTGMSIMLMHHKK